jgi:hypothetical protein
MVFLDGILQDSIGQLGFDPGSFWGTLDVTTQDHTLIRKADDCTGDADTSDVYDPAAKFDGFAIDTFSDLGVHTNNCAAVAVEATSWGAVKSLFR